MTQIKKSTNGQTNVKKRKQILKVCLKNERLPFLFWGTFYCEDLISSDKFCVACHQGYSCHNALRYIRYVDISILYRTLPQERAIHKLHK